MELTKEEIDAQLRSVRGESMRNRLSGIEDVLTSWAVELELKAGVST